MFLLNFCYYVFFTDSGPQTDMEDSTFIVTRGGDPDIKPIYVSILHDHQSRYSTSIYSDTLTSYHPVPKI